MPSQYLILYDGNLKKRQNSTHPSQLQNQMQLLKYLRPLFAFSSTKKSIEQASYYDSRLQHLQNHTYPHFTPTISIPDFLSTYKFLHQPNKQTEKEEKVIGRISAIRTHGKTTFIDIRQQHIKLQIAFTKPILNIRRGDIIGVIGLPFVTKKGELSINATNIDLVSPCLWMLPQHQTLKDAQVRYRKKYLDLITNKQSMEVVKKRSKIMSSLRKYLQMQNFIQVETPILSNSCGGAIAKPFETYHNDYKMNLFMRIAPELYLKKLMIGGLKKVYEIGKNFRNESVDQTHNPEFTSCELYCAYATYEDLMKLTYNMIKFIAMEVNGTTVIKVGEKQIDLCQQWKEVDFMEGLQEALQMKLPIDFQTKQTFDFYDNLCKSKNILCDEPRTIQRLLDKLCERYLEGSLQPLIIKNHPKVMSPLSKPIPKKPHLTQRFQLFINGWQLVNSYTQLNDPHVQRQNTPSQSDFVQGLQYGLTPCGGWGMGIDRLVMLLTEKERIQQVLTFPLLRQLQKE